MLINPALSSQVGSILSFPNDPGFNFEVHIVSWSNESNMITSELKVIAKRQLNGVTVECSGFADSFMSVIHITSADGELIESLIIILFIDIFMHGV